jgi:hypothetical protein
MIVGGSDAIALEQDQIFVTIQKDSVICSDTCIVQMNNASPLLISVTGDTKELRKKKLISAMLAFPFPFGFMGAHRVMLGGKPWIPVVYMATFGGCFGVLPMMDFCAILLTKDISRFENNPHVFMWLK